MSRGRMLLMIFLLLLNIGTAIGVTWSEFASRKSFQELQALREDMDAVDITWKKLVIEKSTWATPGRMERVAREELGMFIPPSDLVVILHVN